MSRLTADAAITQAELSSALEKLGCEIVKRVPGTSRVERGEHLARKLASVLADPNAPTRNQEDKVVRLDAPIVHQDDAVEFLVHHLVLAAMYFEATPDDRCEQIHHEIHRMTDGKRIHAHVGRAATNFVELLDGYYEGLKS